jgi:hypothetical protein
MFADGWNAHHPLAEKLLRPAIVARRVHGHVRVEREIVSIRKGVLNVAPD